jgi:hypothetical protein
MSSGSSASYMLGTGCADSLNSISAEIREMAIRSKAYTEVITAGLYNCRERGEEVESTWRVACVV